jgi:hypothetical protein
MIMSKDVNELSAEQPDSKANLLQTIMNSNWMENHMKLLRTVLSTVTATVYSKVKKYIYNSDGIRKIDTLPFYHQQYLNCYELIQYYNNQT